MFVDLETNLKQVRCFALVAFYLRRDLSGRFELKLHRTPVDLVEERVRSLGALVASDIVNADGVAPA